MGLATTEGPSDRPIGCAGANGLTTDVGSPTLAPISDNADRVNDEEGGLMGYILRLMCGESALWTSIASSTEYAPKTGILGWNNRLTR